MRAVADRERIVAFMTALGLISAAGVRAQFERMAPDLYRIPAIDPPAFRRALDAMFPPSVPLPLIPR